MSENITLEALAAEAAAGDLEAGRALIEALHDQLFALLHLRGVLPSDLDDLAQVAMVQLYRMLGTYDPARPFLPWFRSLVRNVTSNYWRTRGRLKRRTEVFRQLVEHTVPDDDEELLRLGERKAKLAECLESLRDRQRGVVQLRYFQNLDSDDIGRQLNMRGPAVRQLLARTRQMLRECIEGRASDASEVGLEAG